MSMNLNLMATVIATLPNGKKRKFTEHFNLPQTQTSVTYKVMDNQPKYRLSEYINYLKKELEEVDKDEYEDNCIWIKDHIKDLKKWINQHTKEGWTIRWYMS